MPSDRILLYDGVCALCNRVVRFVLRHDKRARFRFAAIQSEVARALLERHGRNPDDLDTFVLVLDPDTPRERVRVRGRAAVRTIGEMGGLFALAAVFQILPTAALDWGYNLVASRRYERFGKFDACPLPPPEHRDRFL